MLPRITEKPSNAHGKYGARKFRIPKKFMRMNGLRRDQTYTSIIVNAWPRNKRLTKKAKIWKKFHSYCLNIFPIQRRLRRIWTIIISWIHTYNHESSTKNEHHNEIRTFSTKWTFFQHTTIAIRKRHIEEKIKTYCSKEEERCDEPPYLIMKHNERWIKIQLKWWHYI